MTTDDVVALMRRKLNDADAADTSTAVELLEYIRDAADKLSIRGHTSFDDMVVNPEGLSITPEPTKVEGHYLAMMAAILKLEAMYNQAVQGGYIGRSWRSGLEEESTISLEKAYRASISALKIELEELIIIGWSPTAGTRIQ